MSAVDEPLELEPGLFRRRPEEAEHLVDYHQRGAGSSPAIAR